MIQICGDFNSVTQLDECLSWKLDDISDQLNILIRNHNLTEPVGFDQFTYQHPSIPERKSKINHFLFSSDIGLEWHSLVKYCAFSDH